jgi:hypothetical protein
VISVVTRDGDVLSAGDAVEFSIQSFSKVGVKASTAVRGTLDFWRAIGMLILWGGSGTGLVVLVGSMIQPIRCAFGPRRALAFNFPLLLLTPQPTS